VRTPVYGNLPRPRITHHKSITKGDTSNIYLITVSNHSGTHVDAPAHFIAGGKRISDYSPTELTFSNPALLVTPKTEDEWVEEKDVKRNVQSNNIDCLLIKTGFCELRGKKVYKTHNPGISPEAILWSRRELPNLRCIGIDSISISGFQDRARGREAHLAAFKKSTGLCGPLLLLEDVNLSQLKKGDKIKKLQIIPWFISGVDSAPCTVLAEVIKDEKIR